MTVLIVGRHKLGSIDRELKSLGVEQLVHWSGLKAHHLDASIPERTDVIVALTDSISHDVLTSIKVRARRRGVSVLYARGARSSIKRAIRRGVVASV